MTSCTSCGSDVGYLAAEDVTVTCSRCVMRRCQGQESSDKAELARLEPAEVKVLRKAKGWTQADLALVLRLPVNKLSAFERGIELPPVEVVEWVASQK